MVKKVEKTVNVNCERPRKNDNVEDKQSKTHGNVPTCSKKNLCQCTYSSMIENPLKIFKLTWPVAYVTQD